jgi:hypothetical protein
MSPRKVCVVLAALIATGCASNPEQATETVATETATAAAATGASTLVAPATPAATGAATVAPDTLLDASQLVRSQPVCREMLRPNSNVRQRYCMSPEFWQAYDRAEAQRAGEIVRTWQGGAYR